MPTSRPNILILHADEWPFNFFGCMGNKQVRTPNIDALANDGGMLFENAYACNGVCVPSRVALMTGRYPIATGVAQNDQMLAPGEVTMGPLFQQGGYKTGYFGKTHFGRDDKNMAGEGWHESFIWHKQYNDYLRDQGIDVHYPEGASLDSKTKYWKIGTSNIPTEHYFENAITDRAIDFVRLNQDNSFLSFVSFVAPHGPFSPPPPYDTMYNPAELELLPRFKGELDGKPPRTVRWIEQNQKYITDDELRIYLAHIYGLCTLVDDCVGRIVAALKETGLYDNTLILFTTDHGDFSSRFGVIGKSWCSLDCLMRTPIILSAPGAREGGRRSAALVDNVDILPTLLAAAGVAGDPKIQGKSLMPIIIGAAGSIKDAVFAYEQYEDSSNGRQYQSMIRRGPWKLTQQDEGDGELYNMENDPWEVHNLILEPEHRELLISLREDLLRWHIANSGSRFDMANANFWVDQTAFYDETKFSGERIHKRQEGSS
jgi:arylsulfatase